MSPKYFENHLKNWVDNFLGDPKWSTDKFVLIYSEFNGLDTF